jgi:hypothetical protein
MNSNTSTLLTARAARKIRLSALVFAILFSAGAAAQYWFVHYQSANVARRELSAWGKELEEELGDGASWNLRKFRQSDWTAPGCFLYTTNGLLLDIEGFVPGFLPPVSLPNRLAAGTPFDFTSAAGEKWRILEEKIEGGTVLLQTEPATNGTDSADFLLLDALPAFGSSIKQAAQVRPRDVNRNVDFAVIDDTGGVRFAIGGVPLQMKWAPESVSVPTMTNFTAQGKGYSVLMTTVTNSAGKPLGVLSIPRDRTSEQRTFRSSVLFNACLALVLWAISGTLSAAFLLKEDRERRAQPITLELALAKGEGQEIEFKGGTVDTKLAASIAAFANTNPGCIFIGVLDNGGVSGLRERTTTEKDELLRRIHDIAKRIDPRVLPLADFIEYEGKIVLRLFITKGKTPPYVVQGSVYRRYLATVSQATADDIRAMVNSA